MSTATVSDLIAMRDRPPRLRQGDNLGGQLCIGLLIDWLDSRPDQSGRDVDHLRRKARRNDVVALAAAGLTDRLDRQLTAGELAFTGHNDHALEYGVAYHAHVAGYLDSSELSIGEEVYRRLLEVTPDCLSGLANLAEIERRRRNLERAHALLESALVQAQASTHERYTIADSRWVVPVRCAIARAARQLGEGGALLEAATPPKLAELVALLREYRSWERAAVPAHQAFSVATAEQRIVLHAAMRLAPIHPQPPPAAHDDFDAVAAVEQMVRERHA